MRDIYYQEIIDEIKDDFPGIPRSAISKFIRSSISNIFRLLNEDENHIKLHKTPIKSIRQIHDGTRYFSNIIEDDETKMPSKEKTLYADRAATYYPRIINKNKNDVFSRKVFHSRDSRNRKSLYDLERAKYKKINHINRP